MVERVITRDRGWSLLRAGASAIDARLDGIVEQAPGKRGLHQAYGWLWGTWLGVPSPNPLAAWLAALVRTNAVRHGVIAPFEGEGGTVSLREAGAMFGVGHARARRIVEELGLVHPASRQGVALALDRAAVTAAARSMDRVLSKQEAGRLLGVGRTQFRALATAGCVPSAPCSAGSDVAQAYDPQELLAFVNRLAGDAPFVSTMPSECAGLPDACRFASVPLTKAVLALKAGQLVPTARSAAPGLRGILVCTRDVAKLRRERVTIAWAARRLGLHYEAARALAASGVLGSDCGLIDGSVVERFRLAHVTAAQAGDPFGLSGGAAAHRLAAAGIAPRFGPPACRQTIYDRDEAHLALRPSEGRA